MSPTRRDVLKSLAVAPIALLVTQGASAADESDGAINAELDATLRVLCDLCDRIEVEHRERQERLVRHAHELGITLEPDTITPNSFIARNPSQPGICQIVSWNTCTCRRFRVWHHCEHVALVRAIESQRIRKELPL